VQSGEKIVMRLFSDSLLFSTLAKDGAQYPGNVFGLFGTRQKRGAMWYAILSLVFRLPRSRNLFKEVFTLYEVRRILATAESHHTAFYWPCG